MKPFVLTVAVISSWSDSLLMIRVCTNFLTLVIHIWSMRVGTEFEQKRVHSLLICTNPSRGRVFSNLSLNSKFLWLKLFTESSRLILKSPINIELVWGTKRLCQGTYQILHVVQSRFQIHYNQLPYVVCSIDR